MAIEQSTMDASISDYLRNAPTPKLIEESFGMIPDSFDFSGLQFGSDGNVAGAFASLLCPNDPTNTIVFSQQGTGSSGQMYPDATLEASGAHLQPAQYSMYAAPYIAQLPLPGSTADFVEIQESGRESVASKLSTRTKEKCMSRNAIAARENREKKKNEVNTLRNRVSTLEEELAAQRKKYNEVKEVYKAEHERLKYFETLFANLSTLGPIIDHMKTLPGQVDEGTAKKLKKKLNINNDLGICFHVKTSKEMSLRFCETCSGGSSSKKRHVET